MNPLDQFIRKPVSDEERFREAKSWGYTDRQAKRYVESARFNGLNILNDIHSLTKLHGDTTSHNAAIYRKGVVNKEVLKALEQHERIIDARGGISYPEDEVALKRKLQRIKNEKVDR